MIHAEAVYIFSSRYPDLLWEYMTSVSEHCNLGYILAGGHPGHSFCMSFSRLAAGPLTQILATLLPSQLNGPSTCPTWLFK